MHRVHLSLGSNQDKERCYPAAVALLKGLGRLESISTVYETEPVGMAPGTPRFFNGAVLMATELEPGELKSRIRSDVEDALGRTRQASGTWSSRTIDVDIALWEGRTGAVVGGRVPHPDIIRYLHVARPLADLSPALVHPVDGRTLAEIAADLQSSGSLLVPRSDIIVHA